MHTTNTAINVIAKYVKRIEIHYIQVRFKFTFIVQLRRNKSKGSVRQNNSITVSCSARAKRTLFSAKSARTLVHFIM